ncbi:MAG TPA: hypothetical protein VG408_11135 [Actinomycetota bacterium]|nr:hypothetical protein [Actinomycetota bacterium]
MHEVWHVLVLLSTLVGAAGLAVLLLGPLVFDDPPAGFRTARPFVIGAVAFAGLLLVLEWRGVHGG